MSRHAEVCLQKSLVYSPTLQCSDEGPETLIGWNLDPLVLVLDEVEHDFREESLPCSLVADGCHLYQNIHTALANAPILLIGLLLIELEQSVAKEALRDLLAYDRQVDNCFLPHLQVTVLSQR